MFMIQRYDVRTLGAKGNATLGISGSGNDDAKAIVTSVAQAIGSKLPAEIYFAPGVYRFTKPWDEDTLYVPSGSAYDGSATNYAALFFTGVNNLSITFAPGAILMMDTGTDVSAICFIGPCKNITLDRVNIEYTSTSTPSTRSAIICYGQSTSDAKFSIKDLTITNGLRIKNAPNEGVVAIGCEDTHIDYALFDTCGMNGIHFYSCHGGRIGFITGRNMPGKTTVFDAVYELNGGTLLTRNSPLHVNTPFGKWSNSAFQIDTIVGEDCSNVVGIAGGYNITINQVSGSDCTSPCVYISSTAGSNPGEVPYSIPASRRIRINNISADRCQALEITAVPKGLPGASMDSSVNLPTANYIGSNKDYFSPTYWSSDIAVGNINCHNIPWSSGFKDGVHVNGVAGVKIGNTSIKTDADILPGTTSASMRLINVQDISLGNTEIIGDGSIASAANGLHVQGFTGNAGTAAEATLFNNISLGDILVDKCQSANGRPGSVRINGIRGGKCGTIVTKNAAYAAVSINAMDMNFDIRIIDPNRGDSTTTKLNSALLLSGSRVSCTLAINYSKVGPVPNLIAVFNPSPAIDCHIQNYQLVSDSVSGGAINFSGTFSTIIGSWLNTGMGTRGGVAYGLGTYQTPIVYTGDNGQLVQQTVDSNNNVRITQVKPGTEYPIISSTGTVIS